MEPTLVIGLGSGRCGTQSLAALLDAQPDATVLHERREWHVPWLGGEPDMDALLDWSHERFARGDLLVGDVGFYYLPYVEYLAERHERVRFVCLKREREATVRSFMIKTRRNANHWRRTRWWHLKTKWNHCFPTYGDHLSKEDAIRRYWDEYYQRAEDIEVRFPELFRVFPVADMNDARGQDTILEFVGVPPAARHVEPGIRENVNKPGASA